MSLPKEYYPYIEELDPDHFIISFSKRNDKRLYWYSGSIKSVKSLTPFKVNRWTFRWKSLEPRLTVHDNGRVYVWSNSVRKGLLATTPNGIYASKPN